MTIEKLYRKRIIPSECILLKDDEVVYLDDTVLITKWKTLKPKAEFDHGASAYIFEKGIKVSKFYHADGTLLYWYCDIVDFEADHDTGTLTVTDLLADVIVYPSGRIKVMDLDELADALEQGLITQEQTATCMKRLDALLTLIDRDKFDTLCEYLDSRDL
jgi:predicted RNA-binding protein associated with RNAse of E/G family